MVILGYHAPVPPPKWDDHHVRIIRDASNKVIHHRKSSEQFKPVTTSQSHFAHPLHAPTVQAVDHGTATYEELHGNFFTSHRDLRRCMGKHTRIVVPKRFGRYDTEASRYGRSASSTSVALAPAQRLLALPDPVPEPYRQRGRRGCKETAYSESLLVTRQKPVDTQWQNHLYMADPT